MDQPGAYRSGSLGILTAVKDGILGSAEAYRDGSLGSAEAYRDGSLGDAAGEAAAAAAAWAARARAMKLARSRALSPTHHRLHGVGDAGSDASAYWAAAAAAQAQQAAAARKAAQHFRSGLFRRPSSSKTRAMRGIGDAASAAAYAAAAAQAEWERKQRERAKAHGVQMPVKRKRQLTFLPSFLTRPFGFRGVGDDAPAVSASMSPTGVVITVGAIVAGGLIFYGLRKK